MEKLFSPQILPQMLKNSTHPSAEFPSLSLSRLSDRGSDPAVPDHPWPGAELHPPTAAPGVDHHALLHHPGHHFPHRHMRSNGDVALAPRSRPIRPVDRLHRE